MNIKIDGNDLLKHMMFWSEKTDDNKEVIEGLKNLGTDE